MDASNQTATTIRFSGNKDQPASLREDALGFRPYVQAVYSFLKHPETKPPFTLSIEGEWGAGKSSFMLQLEQALSEDKQKTVHFNAWRHDKVESMWAAFALQFIQQLTASAGGMGKIRIWWKLLVIRYNVAKGWPSLLKTSILFGLYLYITISLLSLLTSKNIKNVLNKDGNVIWQEVLPVLGYAGVIIVAVMILKKLMEFTGNPFLVDLRKFVVKPDYEGNSDFIEAFCQDFPRLVRVLAEKQKKVFVFIDDLDRTDVPKATDLMQGINMMITDSPKVIFIIGMSRDTVAAGIAYKYKDLLPFLIGQNDSRQGSVGMGQTRAFGYSFLEKFIQLSFRIPTPSPEYVANFVRSLGAQQEELEGDGAEPVKYRPVLTVEDGKDSQKFREVILLLAPYFNNNPRRLKQFVNAFRLRAHIANSTGLFRQSEDKGFGNLTIPQLGKFVALTLMWPELVRYLQANDQLLDELLDNQEPGSDVQKRWMEEDKFMEVLEAAPEEGDLSEYAMKRLNINLLIESSPESSPASSPASPPVTSQATSPASSSSVVTDDSAFEAPKSAPEPSFGQSRKASPKKAAANKSGTSPKPRAKAAPKRK